MDASKITKTYSNGEVTVLWQAEKCIHAAQCVKNLSSVFQPKEKPWIKLENGTSEEIRAAVALCPSGALQMK